ncbi:MAG: DUF4020 domain-containing protein [Rhodospirillaceae bacterium]|nr:DUF4020 domain-containing protein [Rhodospirillaceae bacterium]
MTGSDIRFPEHLRSALRDGEFVVFAGAGVSMGPPACLPDFPTLADSIAKGADQTRLDRETDDAFLGRLHNAGVHVHDRAAQLLQTNRCGNPPRPTALHRDLLRLYPEPDKVRIVTTNFDLLFEAAAQDLFAKQPDLFRAPALPLGRAFNGIVHIHGSLDRPQDIVLTDADFGRAYLTDGWASRFLVELFHSTTVLFVGYSHDDTVMKYLARALPEGTAGRRFILTDEADDNRWSVLGIEPVYFRKNDYEELNVAIHDLANYARRGLLDWRHEITEIARRPPSPDAGEVETIHEALADPTRARFFAEVATDPEWLDWLEKHGYLAPLFRPGPLSERDRMLAAWLVDKIAFAQPRPLFLLFGRYEMTLNTEFWQVLTRTVAYRSDSPMDDETLSRWVSCLLATAPPLRDMHLLLSLGQRCIRSGLLQPLLDIFDSMARHGLHLKPPFFEFDDELVAEFDLPEQDIELELSQDDDDSALNELWESGLKPRLDVVAEHLLSSVAAHLASRHRTYLAWQKAYPNGDPDSLGRDAIEPHEQRLRYGHVDVLIDAANDCLQWLARNRPHAAARWCEQLTASGIPLLRRLGVLALSLRTDLSACEKLDWLLADADLHDDAADHELSRLLREIYPQLAPQQRQRTIESILAFQLPRDEDEPEGHLTVLNHFHWLQLLHDADPGCALASSALADLKARFPALVADDPPAPTPLPTLETLLTQPPGDWLEELLPSQGEGPSGPHRHDLLGNVTRAAQQDFRWGADLALALTNGQHWDTDVWFALFRAWRKAKFSDEQLEEVFGYLGKKALSAAHPARIADLLLAWLEEADAPIASNLLSRANEIASRLWTLIDPDDAPEPGESWHSLAIGRPAGILARYWLTQRSLLREHQDTMPRTFLVEVRAAFSTIAQHSTHAGRQGRAVLAGQFAFLVDVEEQWTRNNLVLRFSEDPGSDDYHAVWDGFLTTGRITPLVGSLLTDAFLQAPPHILTRTCSQRMLDGFVNRYTVMLAHFANDPVDIWLPHFFRHATEGARLRFASEIHRLLRHSDDAQQREAWERWLERYWKHRLEGIPKPLNDAEARHMFAWLPAFETLFATAVELALHMPSVSLLGSQAIYDLWRGNHGRDTPQAVAKLLIHLGKHASPDPTWHRADELIDVLLTTSIPDDLRKPLHELLAKL